MYNLHTCRHGVQCEGVDVCGTQCKVHVHVQEMWCTSVRVCMCVVCRCEAHNVNVRVYNVGV